MEDISMNIIICDNLKELRKKKNNTQEELADFLNVSISAISKWERGECYPDIELLPKIAMYYNVLVDDLLGVGEIREKEKIVEYDKKCEELWIAGDIEGAVAMRREAANEIPNNLHVLQLYMSDMWNQNKRGNNPKLNAEEIIKLGERILREAVDNEWLRYSAIQILSYIYARLGNKEKAGEYAGKAPIYYITQRELYTRVLEGDEAFSHIQGNIMELTDLIELNICQELIRKKEFSNNEKRYLYNYVLSLFKLLFDKGDFGFYYNRTNVLYCNLAICDAIDSDLGGTIKNLELAAQHAINYDTLENGRHTSFLVSHQTYEKVSSGGSNSDSNCSYDILAHMQEKTFDFCREDERFKAIEQNLKKHSKSTNSAK